MASLCRLWACYKNQLENHQQLVNPEIKRRKQKSMPSERELVMVPSAPWMWILEDKLNAVLDSDNGMGQHAQQLSLLFWFGDDNQSRTTERYWAGCNVVIMEVSRHHSTCCLLIRTRCITPNKLARAGAVYREMHRHGSCSSAQCHRLATRFHAHMTYVG